LSCDDRAVFKFFLVDETGDVQNPAGFLTAVPNWTVGETFLMAHGRRFRIREIRTELLAGDARRRVQRGLRRRAGLIYMRHKALQDESIPSGGS